jgi:hypothetical protein
MGRRLMMIVDDVDDLSSCYWVKWVKGENRKGKEVIGVLRLEFELEECC